MLPVAYAHHKCPSFSELTSLSVFSRVSHTSQSRSALKQLRICHREESKAIQSRLRPPIRSLLDVDILKSMLLKKDEEPAKAKVKEKLPPLPDIEKSVTTPVCKPEKILRISREPGCYCAKHQSRSNLDPISHGKLTKSMILPSPNPKLEEVDVDKSMSILKVSVQKFSLKKNIHRRNRSTDLKDTAFDDKGVCNRTFDIDSQSLTKTFSEGLQRYSETGSDSSETGNNFQGVTTGEIVYGSSTEVGIYPYLTLKPSESRSSPILSRDDPSLEPAHLQCSCSPYLFKQANLHYRQLFDSKPGKRACLPTPQPLFVDRKSISDSKQTLGIYFDGVLGEAYKRCLTDTSPKSIRLRKNSLIGLLWLQQNFHLVFLTGMTRARATRVLAYFRNARIVFAAAYLVPVGSRSVLDYTELCVDLHIRVQNLLVVSSLDLAYEDLETVTEETLYVKAGAKVKLTANALPVGRKSTPVSFLVPSLKPQRSSEILPFDLIAGAIQKVRRSKDWQDDFQRLKGNQTMDFATVTTAIVHEVALSQTLSVPRADEVRQGLKPKCALHSVFTWSEASSVAYNDVIVLTQKPNTCGIKGGFEIIETKALRVKSGFLNLLDYTTIENSPQKMKIILDENI